MIKNIDKNTGFDYKGFKLICLKLDNSKLFGNIEYNFINEKDDQNKIYSTVIIGPNGTRKSTLLRLIIFIFKSINDLKNNKEIKYEENSIFSSGTYHIQYSLNHNIYEFIRHEETENTNQKFAYQLKINGFKAEIKEFELPLCIVASSINITDRFPLYKKDEFHRYNYLGIRTSPQAASTRSFQKKTISYIADLAFNQAFLNGLNIITKKFLSETKSICITYRTSEHKKFFNGDLTYPVLENYFTELKNRYEIAPFRVSNFNSFIQNTPEKLDELLKFCNSLNDDPCLYRKKGQSNRTLKYRLDNELEFNKLKDNSFILKTLVDIGLFNDVNIEFEEDAINSYSLAESSSGEHNLVTSFIGLMATIKQDGLILIDEPEISLHPNWQMRYISFLKEMFDHKIYNTSHIIIASHSHFIVSDLEGDSSNIIGLTKEQGTISIVDIPQSINTFGWSAEQVLLDVFKTPTTRNYFIADKIGGILQLVSSKNRDETLIKEKVNELVNDNVLSLSENDPLNGVWQKLINKYGERS